MQGAVHLSISARKHFLFLPNSFSLHSLTANVLESISYISAAFLLIYEESEIVVTIEVKRVGYFYGREFLRSIYTKEIFITI